MKKNYLKIFIPVLISFSIFNCDSDSFNKEDYGTHSSNGYSDFTRKYSRIILKIKKSSTKNKSADIKRKIKPTKEKDNTNANENRETSSNNNGKECKKFPKNVDDIEKIIITIKEILFVKEISDTELEFIQIGPKNQQFDLLKLKDNLAQQVLGDRHIPTGKYSQIRLILIDNNKIFYNGNEYSLKTPSALQSGIKLNGPFEMKGGIATTITLDFDIHKSIIYNKGNGFILKPVIIISNVDEKVDASALIEQPLSKSYTMNYNGQEISYEIRDNYIITEGDINIGSVNDFSNSIDQATQIEKRIRNSIRITGQNNLWPNGTIPFELDANFTAAQNTMIQNTMNRWENNVVSLEFNARNGENNFIRFQLGGIGSGCWSFVGSQGEEQQINLEPGCFNEFIIAHEIAHALGIWHEQSRSDRNTFVTILTANIIPGRENNFNIHDTDGDDLGTYDYDSVMHYGRFAFSRNGLATITPVQTGVTIGQRNHLSTGDIQGMCETYFCDQWQWVAALYQDFLNRAGTNDEIRAWVTVYRDTSENRNNLINGFLFSTEYTTKYVAELYNQLLNRGLDPSGEETWTNLLKITGNPFDVYKGICLSDEFYELSGNTYGGFINRLYEVLLNRAVDESGYNTWNRILNSTGDFDAVVTGILYSDEFADKYVTNVYANYLDRIPDPSGMETWPNLLLSTHNPWDVLRGVIASEEYWNKAQ